jgi:hypothetical protein
MSIVFAALLLAGAAYFLLRNRIFDLLAVAFAGAAFYFSPLLVGHVPDWNGPDPFANSIPLSSGTSAVGIGFAGAVLLAAIIFDRFPHLSAPKVAQRQSLANWYLLLALAGLIGAARSGSILDLNKAFVLTQVGYWFVLFETAASLAFIDAFFCRRYFQLAGATLFLVVDIAIGFRMTTIIVFIAVVFLSLGSRGKIRLWQRLPLLAVVTVGMFLFMLTVNSARQALLPRLGVGYMELAELPAAAPNQASEVGPGILVRLPRILAQSEPFVTQAILSEITRHHFACSSSRLANVAFVIPFAGALVGVPATFESEFKPALFPNYRFGMAGNVWAEAFCEFGYLGIAVEAALLVSALVGIQLLLPNAHPLMAPLLILSGVFLAFYVHRNDLLFELLLIRRAAMVFATAWALRSIFVVLAARIGARALPHRPGPVVTPGAPIV